MNDVETVTVKLAELLRHPEDLDKIAGLKSEFTRKKAAVDDQLKLGLKEQLEITQTGMSAITEGQRTVNLIKEEMMKIDKLCAEAQNMIRDFPHINIVQQTHTNFAKVEEMKENIESFGVRLDELETLLREDDADLENQPNLLQIHYGLTQLRDVRDSAMSQLNGSDDADATLELINNLPLENGGTLQDQFTRLDEVVDWFDEHVGAACINLIALVQSGNNGLVVRLALVVEEEEKKDKKAQALQDAKKEFKDLASRFKSIESGQQELRGYKEKFLKAIELNAQSQMDASNEAFAEDSDKLEKNVRWYFNDLNTVKLGMQTLMPKKWKIFKTYVNIYHKLMHDWLVAKIDDPSLTPKDMLAIINWGDKYYAKMQKLGVSKGELQPALIDEREAELVRDYQRIITKAVEEWTDRMAATDRQNFFNRLDHQEAIDRAGEYRTKTMPDMWNMLREQLIVAGNSSREDVVEGTVDAMFTRLKVRQKMWQQLVDDEAAKYTNAKDPVAPDESFPAFQDWLIALANDQIACIDDDEASGTESFISRFRLEYSELVSPGYASSSTSDLDTLRNGYVDLSTHCLSVFANLIFAVDFRSTLPEFFTPAWYSKKGMAQLINTFEDYLEEYAPATHPSLRDILVEEISDTLLRNYLQCVRNRSAKFRRTDPFTDKIKDDVISVFDFFSRYDAVFPEIKQKWRVVDGFVRMLESDKAAIPLVFEEFRQEYWDVQLGWVEAVLRARDDFERAMVSAVKARAAEMPVERGRMETIMGKVK
ncbi:exocyst complex component Sec6 [Viridothelium virens]|uniref:Exocyst complex component Sec6 n=1 Tax=Viridothelium virens TaxID=1048519 RepID=A0A6A6HF21_VIRVR|nr:exocyst complex component Sec6 [Viridothelium virens]